MDNDDNKKVNNENPAGQETQDAFDNIMNSVYDLARTYSAETADKEKLLRERDEKRREAEMAAIREDIERRYSLQVEETKQRMDNMVGKSSASAETSDTVSRLDEMIDLSAFTNPESQAKEKKKKHKKEAKEKEKHRKAIELIDLDEKNIIYAGLYSLGDVVVRDIERLLAVIIHFIAIPLRKIHSIYRNATAGIKKSFSSSLRSLVRELLYFRREIKSAKRTIIKGIRHPSTLPGILWGYIRKAFRRHKKLYKSFANIAMPVASLAILIFVFSYWNNVTFALDVIYDGKHIGYISDESVFIEAREQVVDRLRSNGIADDTTNITTSNLDVSYKLSIVSPDELYDAKSISDLMIENSVDNLENACGIYIDDKFICAVKNESDAKTVFYNIIEPYEEEADEYGYTVSFAENIDYVQGLYRNSDAVMWDASKLQTCLLGEDGATTAYTMTAEDTIYTVAEKYGVTADYILSLNTTMTQEDFTENAVISVPSTNRLVNIKKTVATSVIKPIAYQTVTRKDSTKYSGYRIVNQNGADGTQKVITTKTYINGVLDNVDVKNEVLVESTDEIITVGTMTTYNGIYIGEASSKGFLWPAPHCKYVSSKFGWRSSGFHKGIDLCTTNGTALGSPVIASRSGTVEFAGHGLYGFGYMVLIDHGDGYKTRYAHLVAGSITVKAGQYVEAGTSIGKVGSTGNSTGPHLHFEVIYNGENYDPANYIY